MRPFVVTIDGPSAAGKSSTARAIAERLGMRYLDTGAYYRAIALKASRSGVPWGDARALAGVARGSAIAVTGSPSHAHVLLDGEDVSGEIRTPEVSELASRVAAVAEVRQLLVAWQRALRESGPLVGEGRDLGTVVFPDADVKLYLDADLDTRTTRRRRELLERGIELPAEEVRRGLAGRDQRDSTRRDSPLRAAEGAVVVDTSGMQLEEQVNAVLAIVRAHPRCPAPPVAG